MTDDQTPRLRRNQNKHYLLALPVVGGYLHSYVAADDAHYDAEQIVERMYVEAEKLGARVWMDVSLATRLDAAATKMVTTFLRKRFPETRATAKKATTFHITMRRTGPNGPDVDWLMELH